jgi:putative oxidoreductase
MKYLSIFARFLVVLPFLFSGVGKITGFEGTVGYATSAGMPFPTIAIILAIIIEIGGSLLLLVGKKWAGTGAMLLVIFTVVATYYFHNFWAVPEAMKQMQQIMFFKNVAIIGGLLVLFVQYKDECILMNLLCKGKRK